MFTSNDSENEPNAGWYFLIIATGILASLSISLFVQGGIGDMEKLKKKKKALQKEYQKKQARLKKLKRRKKRLHHDPYLIEKLARRKLGLDRPGEKVVEFNEEKISDTPTSNLREEQFSVPSEEVGFRTDTPSLSPSR